eukprot:TCONS_00042387-protein
MPHLKIRTTQPASDFDQESFDQITDAIAAVNDKPKSYFLIDLKGDQKMSFGGTMGKVAHVTFSSIGKINAEMNAKCAAAIFKSLNAKGVPSDRQVLVWTIIIMKSKH